MRLWMCMSFCQWAFQAYFVEGHVFVNVYVLLSVSLPSLLRRRSCVCECVCPSVSKPSKLTSSKVMCLWMCMSFCQWAFQAYFVEGHVFVNVYVLLSVSLPSLLRRRSCVCECLCPSVSEPFKLTSSKVMCLWMCMSFCQWAFQAYFVEGHVFVNVHVLFSVSLPSLLRRRSCVCECVCPSVSEPSKLTSSKVMCLWMCMSFCQWAFQAYFVEGHVFVNVYVLCQWAFQAYFVEGHVFVNVYVLCQWAFQAYFVEGHVFVNVYVLLSVSLPSLLRQRSCVGECVCPWAFQVSSCQSNISCFLVSHIYFFNVSLFCQELLRICDWYVTSLNTCLSFKGP